MAAALLMAGSAFFVACTPTVNTEILQRYAPLPLDSVKVYDNLALVPSSATAIGKVRVAGLEQPGIEGVRAIERVGLRVSDVRKDANGKVLMAKVMAADAGGNGLLISNGSEVDYLKSYYFGTILHSEDNVVDDNAVDTNAVSPAVKAHEYSMGKLSEWVKKHKLPSNIVKLSVGPAWITSKVYVGSEEFSGISAFNLMFQYSHLWKTGWGCGLQAFQSHFKVGDSSYSNYGGSANIFYLGPSLTYAYRTDKGWLWTMNYSMGYTSIDEADSYSGFGMTFDIGVDYMLTKHIGVGVDVMEYTGYFKAPAEWKQEHSDMRYGYAQIGIFAGIRAYF